MDILELLLHFNDSVIGISLVDIQDNTGNTALHYSIIFNNIKAFDLLIKYDSNILINDNNDDDSLHLSVLYKRKDILEKILKVNNVNINSINSSGETVLHYASNYNLIEIASILIKNTSLKIYTNGLRAK